MIAWSSPGAALLITRLPGEAIGTYSVASGLIVLSGLTGTFDRLMRRIAGPWPPPCWRACCSKCGVPLGTTAPLQRPITKAPVHYDPE
jgi:benzoate membrane transport protein